MEKINFAALRDPFPVAEIEWRLQQAGEKNGRVWAIAVPYVTNRAIQSRLDEVVGPAHWQNRYRPGPGGGVLCGISIRIGEEWVTKWDGAENTDVEGVKGGLSGAMKRAAVQWGVGRYLYGLDEHFVQVRENGSQRGKTKEGKPFRWDPPALPAWALPESSGERLWKENAGMLDFIRTVGPDVPDAAEIQVDGQTYNLKAFVRENWSAIKEQPRTAREVVLAVASATGTAFEVFQKAA